MLTNSTADQPLLRQATAWALPFVETVVPLFEARYPTLPQPRAAVVAAQQYVQGQPRSQALRVASLAAFKLGKDVDSVAKAVTQATSAIAAVAYTHTDLRTAEPGRRQAQHVLGPVAYAAYALALAQTPAEADAMVAQAIATASIPVRELVRAFPPQSGHRSRLAQLLLALDQGLRHA